MTTEDATFMFNFFSDMKSASGIEAELNSEIQSLWNKYKLPELTDNCTIITADFGKLGTIVTRKVVGFDEDVKFKYKSGGYDYISIKANPTKIILWTDYSPVEPFNRQGGLYGDGSSFESLGEPVKECEDYREFQATYNYVSNICFGVWGYSYNDFHKSVRFGICIQDDKVEEFISKLRSLLNK